MRTWNAHCGKLTISPMTPAVIPITDNAPRRQPQGNATYKMAILPASLQPDSGANFSIQAKSLSNRTKVPYKNIKVKCTLWLVLRLSMGLPNIRVQKSLHRNLKISRMSINR